MSLQRRRERYCIIHLWKIVKGIIENDLNFDFYDNLRLGIMARIPSINTTSSQRSKSLYDASFPVLGPRLWNIVPKQIKECSTLFTFKAYLDEFLRSFPDRPPVPGYVCQNNNSILDWRMMNPQSL